MSDSYRLQCKENQHKFLSLCSLCSFAAIQLWLRRAALGLLERLPPVERCFFIEARCRAYRPAWPVDAGAAIAIRRRRGRSQVRKVVPPPSHTGGLKSRRRIAVRRYACVL